MFPLLTNARIVLSALIITGAVAAIGSGATGAFFSDTETSTNNTFAAGALDLKVDNDSYYNGNRCVNLGTTEVPNWQWQGSASYPTGPCTTSWTLDDLSNGHLFFNFLDLKPDDEGEDTISLHIQNDAWACMNISLTSNDDNSMTEPEDEVDDAVLDSTWDGELAQALQTFWWADDGDNVFEDNENAITPTVTSFYDLATTTPFKVALADSQNNVWTGVAGPMLAAQNKYYIGKAWCLGTLSTNPVAAGAGVNPSVASGVTCNGVGLNNLTQTDSTMLDISFTAEQARHNPNFRCAVGVPCTPSISNIFVNGGFEEPEVTNGSQWDVFPAAITGWTIAWRGDIPTIFNTVNRPEPGNLEIHEGVLGVAHGGDQYVELDSDWNGHTGSLNNEPASTVISQTITTIPGASYTVEFWFAPRPNTPPADNVVEARFNGVLLGTAGPLAGGGSPLTAGSWIQQGPYVFVATSTSAVVSFTDMGTANSLGSFIDDVTVLQTICPNI